MDKVVKQIISVVWSASDSLLAFYTKHEWYQFVLVIPLTIVAFIYGRSQQNKELQTVLQKLNNTDQYKINLGKQSIINFKRFNRIKGVFKAEVIMFCLILSITLLYYVTSISQTIPIKRPVFYIIYITLILLMGLTYLIQIGFHKKTQNISRQLKNISDEEKENVKTLLKHLGDKMVKKLKRSFERNIIDDEEKKTKERCKKRNCQFRMQIFRESSQFYDNVIKSMIAYQWCSFCKTQLEIPNKKSEQLNFEDIKANGKSLDDLKRFFNQLLQFYNSKQNQLQQVCTNQCCKQFYQVLKPLSQRFYQQYNSYEQRLMMFR